jgi:hypothetical protein
LIIALVIIVSKVKVNPAPTPIKTPGEFNLSVSIEPPVAAKKQPPIQRRRATVLFLLLLLFILSGFLKSFNHNFTIKIDTGDGSLYFLFYFF